MVENKSKKVNPLFTAEWNADLCRFIELFQYLENTLKDIYAKLIDGHYPKCFDEVDDKPIGQLIKILKKVEKENKTNYLTNEDYDNLLKVKDMRNYWCHRCYVEGNSYVVQEGISIITKSRNLPERLKKEIEIVRQLGLKLGKIEIPEKVGKWKFQDFCTITGLTFIPLTEN